MHCNEGLIIGDLLHRPSWNFARRIHRQSKKPRIEDLLLDMRRMWREACLCCVVQVAGAAAGGEHYNNGDNPRAFVWVWKTVQAQNTRSLSVVAS